MAEYTLPELPYAYDALAPHISAEIMELHHSKHHAAYVAGANAALAGMAEAREDGTIGTKALVLSRNLAFHLGGHTNHTIFWNNMSPDGGDKPEGELLAAITDTFGSFDKFQAHFTGTAMTIQGSGWAVLAWDQVGQQLIIEQMEDQSNGISIGIIPIVMLDMWEHAFYLQYKNVKGDYVKNWWNVVNWADAAGRFDRARTQTAGLILPA